MIACSQCALIIHNGFSFSIKVVTIRGNYCLYSALVGHHNIFLLSGLYLQYIKLSLGLECFITDWLKVVLIEQSIIQQRKVQYHDGI